MRRVEVRLRVGVDMGGVFTYVNWAEKNFSILRIVVSKCESIDAKLELRHRIDPR